MRANLYLVLLAAAATATTAEMALRGRLRTRQSSSNCTEPEVRVEWDNLSRDQQKAYLDAERCLWDLPAQTMLYNATSLYTDLVALHQNLSDYIHNDGVFLPWHRYFLHARKTLLKEQCNYNGSTPWWDERPHAGAFANASVFSPDTFGSLSGTYNGGEGYFANATVYLGPGYTNEASCLSRNVINVTSAGVSATDIDACNEYDNYTSMWSCVFPGPHGDGHGGIGGVMNDAETSPGDPIFFLHHGFIDRNWCYWQNQDPDNCMYQINGYTTQTEPEDGWVETTLDYALTSYQMIDDTTIGNVMDTEGGYLCYTYDS